MNLRNFRHESRDDYLEAILIITNERGHCRAVNIAEELDVSKPSVSVAVAKLTEEGLIRLDDERLIHLTETGLALARQTYAKHCYFKAFLQSAGVEEAAAELEACAIEHAVSEETFRKIRTRYPLDC